jgi:autotransporter-associated beta strand protein
MLAAFQTGTGTSILHLTTTGLSGSGKVLFGDLGGGSGVVSLEVASNYSGSTTLNTATGGQVQLAVVDALPTSTVLSVTRGILDLKGFNQTVASLAGASTADAVVTSSVAGSTFTISSASGTTSYAGVVSGSLSLSKGGNSTQSLTGNNTFTGPTTITGGTLEAAAIGALGQGVTGTSGITVNSGGTLLLSGSSSVTDRINNNAALNLNGGVANAAGIVTFNTGGLSEGAAGTAGIGALTLTSNSIIDFGSGTSLIEFTGGGIYTGGTLFINNWSGNAVAGNGTDRLLFSTVPDSSLVSNIQFDGFALGQNAALNFGSYYEIVPVPEPGTIFSALGLLGMAGWRERRKMRQASAVERRAFGLTV